MNYYEKVKTEVEKCPSATKTCNTSKLYHCDYMNEFNYPDKLFIWW